MNLRLQMAAAIAAFSILQAAAQTARADIKNWQTGQTISGTAGLVPGPHVDLSNWKSDSHNLRYADFGGGLDLSGATFAGSWLENARFTGAHLQYANFGRDIIINPATLENADLSQADLTNASIYAVPLNGANLTDAIISNVNFSFTGLTEQQLYSTASHKNHELPGIAFQYADISGWNLGRQNLQGAFFANSSLTNTSLRGTDLTGASFYETTLSGADLTDAIVTNTYLALATSRGFVSQQLYSTASYKKRDLSGIILSSNDLSGWNLSGQNLADSIISGAILANTDLRFADLRSAVLYYTGPGPILRNTILPYSSFELGFGTGFIEPLALGVGERLVIRNHQFRVTIHSGMTLADGSVLELRFTGGDWTSAIDIGRDVVPDLGGTLDLRFADGADPATLVGTKFHLFYWNGQLVTGDHFDHIDSLPGYVWDTSQLYTSGDVTLTAVPEPSAMLLAAVCVAIAGAGRLVRRRR